MYPGSAGGGGGVLNWVGVAVGVFFTVVGVASLAMTAGLSAPVSVPLIGLGATTTTTGTVALVATTALTAASTAASAVNAANGDQTAGSIAMWTGVAALGVGMGSGATKAAMRALNKPGTNMGVRNLIFAGKVGQPGTGVASLSRSGSMVDAPVSIPRPKLLASSPSASPITGRAAAVANTNAGPVLNPDMLSKTRANLRPAAPAKAANAGGLDEIKLAARARREGKTVKQAIEAAKAAQGQSLMMENLNAKLVANIRD
ncbi:hypothetical protein BKM26_12005 [Pseudomonas avellanae pv. morsprunorum]|uniref:Uncharacterized protein n=1 Tax=Pseudomonas avellanae pv. morsprunorum TaxID=3380385 RepID=A0ABX4YYN4_9PSED|nr:hypothetical protein BKM26_12005 [Pseudomonas avellanae]